MQTPAEFQILEVVSLKRRNNALKTENKSCYVLSCRTAGESTFFYNGEAYPVRRGDVLYIPAGASYRQECNYEELIAVHLNVNCSLSNEIQIYTPDDPEKMCRLFQSLALHWQENTVAGLYYCKSELYQILAISQVANALRADNAYGVISPGVMYLQGHLYDWDLSLDAVCKQVPISHTSFIKHFRKHFHCTPIKYINRQRINRAKMLLSSHLYTREEIARLCGFENVKHFYMMFKKITGCTTGEYLQNLE